MRSSTTIHDMIRAFRHAVSRLGIPWAAGVLILSLGLTFAAWHGAETRIEAENQAQFNSTTNEFAAYRFAGLPGYLPSNRPDRPLMILGAGIGVSLLVSVIAGFLAMSRARVVMMNKQLREHLDHQLQIERQLVDAKTMLHDAVETISEGFVIFDRNDRLVICNEAYRRLYRESGEFVAPGVTFEELLRRGAERGQYPEAVGREEEWIAERLRQHREADGAVEQRLRDGRWLLVSERHMSNGGIAGLRVDISALKAALEALRDSQERFKRAQRLAGMGSIERDLESGTMECSDETYRLFGVDKSNFELTRENLLSLVHDDDRERVRATMAATSRGENDGPFEFRIVRPDGNTRCIMRDVDMTLDENGKTIRYLIAFKDVTEIRAAQERQRQLERQLNHAQKLEALGTLAGGIAHDLNNTLVPIVSLSKLTARKLAEGSRERNNLDMILTAADRARDLVSRILAFSRNEPTTRIVVDLAALLRNSLQLLRASIPSTIRFEERVYEVPPILADPGQLHQIIMNLVVNASQAIGGKTGVITVELAAAAAEGPDAAAGQVVRLRVRDTGCGMEPAIVERIFEPFFTTKGVGEGTGLGLSVVHGIVTEHGGRITVESLVGEGTCFTVELPVLSEFERARHLTGGLAA